MKKLTLSFLFVFSACLTHVASANTAANAYPSNTPQVNTSPVWPGSVPVYRWPTQQAFNQPSVVPTTPMYPNNTQIPRAVPMYPAPYNTMRYPSTSAGYPPVLRYPANQTFQQARPVYNFNMPYGTPRPATPYAGQYNSQLMQRQPSMMPQQPSNMATFPANKPVFPAKKKPKEKEKKPWGDTRNIWPDFYTDSTGEMWDDMMNAPYDMGRMPGGWRAPSLSTPDPVTVGDAVANQVPPVADEVPNFMPFMN